MSESKIDIVIVNWNSGDQLANCIKSIQEYSGSLLGRCVVVDNGSTDGSVDFLARETDIDLICVGANIGFGQACNLGAKHAESPFLLFLNPDAFLSDNSLNQPLALLEDPTNSQVGIVGITLVNNAGEVQRTCARFPNPWYMLAQSVGVTVFFPSANFKMCDWDHAETREVDHVIGAFMLIRRSLFEKLGGFDERFFVYLEDLDLSLRAKRAGYLTVYCADAKVIHTGGGVSEQVKAHRLFYSLRSRIQYAAKHFSRPAALGIALSTLLIEPLTRLAQLLLKRRFREVGDLWRGYGMLWRWALHGLVNALQSA